MQIRLANPEDSAAICALLEDSPMGESIRLTFERRPDYFAGAGVQAEEPHVVIAESAGQVLGLFAAGRRRVFVDGQPASIRYLSDLRLSPDRRGSLWLAKGYRLLRTKVFDENEVAQTMILSDNAAVLDLLTSRRAGLPGYFPAGEYATHFIPPRQRAIRTTLDVRAAEFSDIPVMQEFFDREAARKQFYPCYDFSRIGADPYYLNQRVADYLLAFDGGKLVGMLGIWDQRSFRQTRILGYRGLISALRVPIGLMTGMPLPPAGSTLPLRYLHSVVCQENDPAVLKSLIGAALGCDPGFRGYLVLGLDASDALNQAVARSRKRTVTGRHFLVSFADRPAYRTDKLFYFEAARI